ncbi:hypothetical protein ACHQM5_028301 [Ranunculus cassubicifolius]
MRPSSLLSLAIESALLNISHISDLSSIPEPILSNLFLKTLEAGKLTEKILNLFIATGSDEVLAIIKALNIQPILSPVLRTRCSEKF